jgi:hypothetical protein
MSEDTKIEFFGAAIPLWSAEHGFVMQPVGWPGADFPLESGNDTSQSPELQAPTEDEAVLRFRANVEAAAAEAEEPVTRVDLSPVQLEDSISDDDEKKSKSHLCFNSRAWTLF